MPSTDKKHWRLLLFAGQSNLVGSGTAALPSDPHLITTLKWDSNIHVNISSNGIYDTGGKVSQFPYVQGNSGFGPMHGCARYLAANGIANICCVQRAWSGSALSTRWLKSLNDLYPLLITLTQASIAQLVKPGDTYDISLFWFQGEGCDQAAESTPYEANLAQLIADVRSDLSFPTMRVVIGRSFLWSTQTGPQAAIHVPIVRAAQQSVAAAVGYGAWVNIDDAVNIGDNLHCTQASKEILGVRMAQAWLSLQ